MKRWLFALLLALLASTRPAAALPPRAALPGLNVAALVVAGERLYVGGFDDGLFVVERDGSARRIQHPALSPHINALGWSERAQTLWLGTARGLLRCVMRQKPSCSRLGSTSAVHALLLRSDDSVIAGGDAGLAFVNGSATRVFGKKQSAPFRSVWALAEADGKLYVGSTNGLFWGEPGAFASGGKQLERASVVLGNLPDDWVTALLPQGEQLLVGTYNAGVVSFTRRSGLLSHDAADRALGYVNPAGLFTIDETSLAVASMDGLRAGKVGRTALVATKTRDVTALAPSERAGGGYWVGTRRGLEWVASLGL